MHTIRRDHLNNVTNLPRPRVYRLRNCPFDTLSDAEFKKRDRFTRDGFFKIVDLLSADLDKVCRRSSPLTTAQRLAMCLQVLASNQFQLLAADTAGVSQSTASRSLSDITDWFVAHSTVFIQWHTPEEEKAMQIRVFNKFQIPGVVGCIDGSHVRIMAPKENEDAYVNR